MEKGRSSCYQVKTVDVLFNLISHIFSLVQTDVFLLGIQGIQCLMKQQ